MIRDKSLGARIFDIANAVFLGLVVLLFVFPFVHIFCISISSPEFVQNNEVSIIPRGITLQAYQTIFNTKEIYSSYYNSILYAGLGTVWALFVTTLAAYPLSRKNLKYKKPFIFFFTFTMFFSGGLIPTFLLYADLKLIDTIWVIVLPAGFSFWNIILMRTNFQQLPSELYESAYLDGANDWVVLLRIVLPLSKAIIATISLFVAVSQWNSYFAPLMYLTSGDRQPLTILLRRILVSNEVFADMGASIDLAGDIFFMGKAESLKMATIFVTIGSIIFIYPFVQKYFVKGVMVGSIKG